MTGGIVTILGNFLRRESGASMVEFTLLAPLLIALGLGAGEFGRALQHHHVVSKSARDAARFLARVPVDCSGGTGSVTDPTNEALARNLARTGYINGTTPVIDYWTSDSTITITIDCFDNSAETFRGKPQIPQITVSIALPYQDMGFLDVLGVSGTLTLRGMHQQMHIGE